MSCAEFLYPVFQAYDFLHLHKHHNCWLQASLHMSYALLVYKLHESSFVMISQLGGCDQWGNITAGCDFVRRSTGNIVHGRAYEALSMVGCTNSP